MSYMECLGVAVGGDAFLWTFLGAGTCSSSMGGSNSGRLDCGLRLKAWEDSASEKQLKKLEGEDLHNADTMLLSNEPGRNWLRHMTCGIGSGLCVRFDAV